VTKMNKKTIKSLSWGIFASALALGAACVTITVGWRPIIGPRHRALTSRKFESTRKGLERGEYLVQHVAACTLCHSSRDHDAGRSPTSSTFLAGAHISKDETSGDVYAPNLTPDFATGIGSWSDDQLARAIREGLGYDGHALFPVMPYQHFHSMSDEDLASVVVYLRSISAVRNPQPQTKLVFSVRLLIRSVPEPLTWPVPEPDRSTPEKRGAYLAKMAICSDCHTPKDQHSHDIPGMEFAGGGNFEGTGGLVTSANLTPDPSGIPYYDEKLFIQTMRTGFVGARPLNQTMPWNIYQGMTDADLGDIFAYLKTLKPVRHGVDNSLSPTYCKLCRQFHGGGTLN
jgi:mono/diheme cytochrome c family protein